MHARTGLIAGVLVVVVAAGSIMSVTALGDRTSRTRPPPPATAPPPPRPAMRARAVSRPAHRTGATAFLHHPTHAPLLYPGLMGALRTSDPWALPPKMLLGAWRGGATGSIARLAQVALRQPGLAFAPSATRAINAGDVSPAALALLIHLPQTPSPFLVLHVTRTSVLVQATNLRTMIIAIDRFQLARSAGQPSSIQLIPASASETDLGAPLGASSPATGGKAVAIALRYLGVPYVWGGASPSGGFDCSGLVMYVYAQLGVHLDHYTGLQWLEGKRIPADQLRPGDTLFFIPEHGSPGHEGMYIGGGRMIVAPHSGTVVQIQNLADLASVYIGAVRPY